MHTYSLTVTKITKAPKCTGDIFANWPRTRHRVESTDAKERNPNVRSPLPESKRDEPRRKRNQPTQQIDQRNVPRSSVDQKSAKPSTHDTEIDRKSTEKGREDVGYNQSRTRGEERGVEKNRRCRGGLGLNPDPTSAGFGITTRRIHSTRKYSVLNKS